MGLGWYRAAFEAIEKHLDSSAIKLEINGGAAIF
jgi:hypothetical protein